MGMVNDNSELMPERGMPEVGLFKAAVRAYIVEVKDVDRPRGIVFDAEC